MPADDIIRDLVRQVWKLHPEMTDSELCNFEMQLRAEFSGKEYYLKKKAAAEGRKPSR